VSNEGLELLKRIAKDVADIKAALSAGAAASASALGVQGSAPSSGSGGGVASDRDLDSEHGDPEVRRDPKDTYWIGASYVGCRFSTCPPDYLDAMAKYKDACAYASEKEGKPEKQKYVAYDRRDAARARGWAARLRGGWKPAGGGGGGRPLTDDDYGGADNDVPF
jgi:hypothetical protein